MSNTVFCKSFTNEILTLYKDKTLKVVLVTNGADTLGPETINKSQIESHIITGTEKPIVTGVIEGSTLYATNPVWLNATFNVRYAVVFEEGDGNIIFFIDLGTVKNINNSNFELDWSSGFIKIG